VLILVSNDDGFFTDGIKTLAKRLREIGDVYVVAPDREQSATGHSLTLHRPLRVKATKRRANEFMVDGTPTDCVSLGANKLLPRKPDLIVSGINRGANLGDDVTYSGTVAAALEGALLGIPGIAVSATPTVSEDFFYEAAADFAAFLALKVMENGLTPGTILNVNVPSETQVGDHRCVITRMGKRVYSDVVEEKIDPRGKPYYWIGGPNVGSQVDPGTDCEAASQGRISVTPIHLDMTNYTFLSRLANWKLPVFES
jgi:5'-nucleotidase